jgi:hypothetical protein
MTNSSRPSLRGAKPSLRSQGIKPKRGRGIYKHHTRPNQSEAAKKFWSNPEYRAKHAAAMKAVWADRKANPIKYSRAAIPNGYRKAKALEAWAIASATADDAMARLRAAGLFKDDGLDLDDDALAAAALREAFCVALGPGNLKTRLEALRIVLAFTKAAPPTAVETRAMLDHCRNDQAALLVALLSDGAKAAQRCDGAP